MLLLGGGVYVQLVLSVERGTAAANSKCSRVSARVKMGPIRADPSSRVMLPAGFLQYILRTNNYNLAIYKQFRAQILFISFLQDYVVKTLVRVR